jgi:DNA invertase Pin-like site-specific DNA recombinase
MVWSLMLALATRLAGHGAAHIMVRRYRRDNRAGEELTRRLDCLRPGDMLMVTRVDRLARRLQDTHLDFTG